jgi:glycosyltransferase involved in cell wall biosynthesis
MPTLILLFTQGMSLKEWRRTGMLSRELALYRALLPHYDRILLASYGRADDLEVLHAALPPDEAHRFTLIANARNLPLDAYTAQLPALIQAALPDASPIILKTNQLAGADIAVSIADHLRATGRTVALIARGGYHWSAFAAHEHGPNSPRHADALARERLACARADLVVGTSQEMLDALTTLHALDPAKTALIPNYVIPFYSTPPLLDPSTFLSQGRTIPLVQPPPTFLYAGQLITRKRIDLLIEAFAHWRTTSKLPWSVRGPARLDIYGDGPQSASLRQLATCLSAPVFFYSRVPHDELLGAMARCTLYIQPSVLEGHPKTVIEAMAAGVPVLVADAPGMDVITDGQTGRKVPPTVPALVAAMDALMHDPAERDRLAANAARYAHAHYGLDTILRLELAAHQRALAAAPQPLATA